ncbi:imidazolonepropionase [Sporolactobacillus terrae]|uniref:Imidazolonepropionase n=1 Tax=Sporolactobacillus terrae TaxID=269673 RepID=A0ABX5Q3Y1_9BACL|nr:imidazolonepropionase [Sporolactobacillus terrae]QAA21349.1 imidazolonepropionase [Sporolactobacillus terrae]QAA24321.1 imidazolonepropionase [Sporolactobacillus terrae]UAK16142.1 imidazolonepropionase [Sporolactobacillus terrae]
MNKRIVLHASEIATPTGTKARVGKEMSRIKTIKDGAIVIEDGMIVAVDTSDAIMSRFDLNQYTLTDASGKSVVPGFIDSHTHFIFGGFRPDEFLMRLSGKSYMEIMKAGGGIENTVQATRADTFESLYSSGRQRLDGMVRLGITTVEGKSGYGLDMETELRMLRVMKQLNADHPVDVVSTYLGAHAIPREFKTDHQAYIQFMMEKVIPKIAQEHLADFCDVFCEDGVFSINESRQLLNKAKKYGLLLKIHADEIESMGGAELAAEVGTASADHLLEASEAGIRSLAEKGIVATLLPATAFCLNKPFAGARKMIDAGCAVALGSDFNPGSCFTYSVPLIFALAGIHMQMSSEETLTAFTLNGAAALKRSDTIGTIESGKRADLVLLSCPSYKYLIYHTAMNCVHTVIKNGQDAF